MLSINGSSTTGVPPPPVQFPVSSHQPHSFVIAGRCPIITPVASYYLSCDLYIKYILFPPNGHHPILIHYHRVLQLLTDCRVVPDKALVNVEGEVEKVGEGLFWGQ